VIPCYNAAEFIKKTIQSALEQTLAPIEIIVVDDGSTDDSANLADELGSKIRTMRQPNQGESVARNNGFEAATGEFVAFLDADDQWEPQKLERQVSTIGDGIANITGVTYFGADNSTPAPPDVPSVVRSSVKYICDLNSFLPSALLVRRTVKSRFPTWTKYGEDYVYSLDLALEGHVSFIDEPLTRYRIHVSSQSAHPATLVRQDQSVRRWLETHSNELGASQVQAIRKRQISLLASRARVARQSRQWEKYWAIRDYLADYSDSAAVAIVNETVYPKWAYALKDRLLRPLTGS
jgi:glycosyltransferase involved in cell wall biosynthesis